ncbi:MAG: hypothetical protein MI810_22530, partial [Flavobacteriales bacterium]|nr:hypothetical protein [Flavobacteriales bacterium]
MVASEYYYYNGTKTKTKPEDYVKSLNEYEEYFILTTTSKTGGAESTFLYNCNNYGKLIKKIRTLEIESKTKIKTRFCKADLTFDTTNGNPAVINFKRLDFTEKENKQFEGKYKYDDAPGTYDGIKLLGKKSTYIIKDFDNFVMATAEAARFTHLERAYTSVFNGNTDHESLKLYKISHQEKSVTYEHLPFWNVFETYFLNLKIDNNLLISTKNSRPENF